MGEEISSLPSIVKSVYWDVQKGPTGLISATGLALRGQNSRLQGRQICKGEVKLLLCTHQLNNYLEEKKKSAAPLRSGKPFSVLRVSPPRGGSGNCSLLSPAGWRNLNGENPEDNTNTPAVVCFSCSVVSDSATPWAAARQASLSLTISRCLLKLMSIKSVMPSNHLLLCRPLLLLSIFSNIRVFFNESALRIRWPKYWSFSFSISPSNEYSGLISFRIDWFDLLDVPGTLKSLLQHHSSKASILQRSVFFMVQLSHPYMTPGKTIALTRHSFVSKGPPPDSQGQVQLPSEKSKGGEGIPD